MVSAVILTKNEEVNIIDCIESVSFCDEIIIIDDNSTDRTVPIIENLKNEKIKVYQHALENNFAQQRNYGLEVAIGDWIFFVDADERVPLSLKEEIRAITHPLNKKSHENNGYLFKRHDYLFGKVLQHGEIGHVRLLRLGKKDCGTWKGAVHEEWKIKGSLGECKNALQHYPHQNIKEFLQEINFYSTLRAQELHKNGARAGFISILLYPKAKFFLNFFLRRGYKDGIQGFVFAIFMSFHSFMVRGKLWQLCDKTE